MSNIFLGMNIVALLIVLTFIGIGVWDLYLYSKGKKTLTQRLHLLVSNKAMRIIILCVIMGLVWAILGPNYFATALPFVVLGHLLWNE
jgi:hypothetical protein